MTDITKRRLKNITNHAFEVCVGSTIYSFMSEFENAAINKLYSAIKKKTTATVIIKTPGSDLVLSNDEEKRNIAMVLMRDYLCEKPSDASIDTNYLSSKLIFYRNTPILITAPKKNTDERSSLTQRYSKGLFLPPLTHYYGISDPPVLSVRSAFTPHSSSENNNCFTLTTFRTAKHEANLNRFVQLLKKKAKEYNKPASESKYINIDSPSTELSYMKKRSMETVFMHQNVKDDLINSIDAFVNKKDWYDTNFVPYHFGILLYGPPGTGKSTLIRALITEYAAKYKDYKTPTYLSYIHEICRFSNEKIGIGGIEPKPRLVILEDIDAALLQKRQSAENVECVDIDPSIPQFYDRNTSLSEVLNKIDGVNNTENIIYIFTTNHIENLDPALLRPGRIDKLIKIDTPDRDCYDQFMFYHFGKHIPEDVQVTSDKLIAELQNEIVCEKSFDEVLDLIRVKE